MFVRDVGADVDDENDHEDDNCDDDNYDNLTCFDLFFNSFLFRSHQKLLPVIQVTSAIIWNYSTKVILPPVSGDVSADWHIHSFPPADQASNLVIFFYFSFQVR